MILVTGANGHLGRAIVHHLANRLGSDNLAVSVRDPAKAEALARRGIAVRQGDFDRPENLAQAFSGAERLVLVSTDGPKEARIAQHANAIRAARAAGVKHIVYTSFLDVAADSPAEFAAVHNATEAALRESGLGLTLLRNTIYADFLPMFFAGALQSGVLQLPAGEGKLSFITRDELAQVAAAAAAAPRPAQEVYHLTGQVAHGFAEIAGQVAKATGKAIRYEPVAEADYAAALAAQGLPAWLAAAMANMFSAVAEGRFAAVGNDFARLVGHPPRSLECLVAELFPQ